VHIISEIMSAAAARRSARLAPGKEVPAPLAKEKEDDVRIRILEPCTLVNGLHSAAEHTAAGGSLTFLGLFLLCAYFHESFPGYVGGFMVIWVGVQVASHALRENLNDDLFWNIVGALGNVVFYLIIGYVWTFVKLYLDVWQGHLPTDLADQLQACMGGSGKTGCIFVFLGNVKWLIVHWMLTWPVSMTYTLSRDPLRIAIDLAFELSRQRYIRVLKHAFSTHSMDAAKDVDGGTTILLWCAAYVISYILIGYLWTHAKLFLDVWKGRLPKAMDDRLRSVYEKKTSYWSFVRDAKWLIMRWIITWPFSVMHTVLRDPVRMITEFVYKLSHRKYVSITRKAMEWRSKEAEREAAEDAEEEEQ